MEEEARIGLKASVITTTLSGNTIAVIEDGPDLRSALLDLIDGARTSLKLCYYIFESDESGRMVLARLIHAARRGVRVTLMVDAFGGATAENGFFDALVAAGGQFGWFGARRSTRYLIRNHQKIAIADDARLLMGGFNVGDAYFGIPEDNCWRDIGLFLEGPEVAAMVRWYRQLWRWTKTRKQSFRVLRTLVRRWRRPRPVSAPSAFHWLIGGPTRRLSPWAQVVKHDLDNGTRIDMIEAYFSPGRGMLRRIWRLARRKGARLILPAKSDNGATIAAARLLYGPLLKRGVKIYEYQPCKLHMKLIVIDDAVYIGSANFDMRSLFLNLELMLRIEDASFAAQIRTLVDRRQQESTAITPEVYAARRGPLVLLKGWISYLIVGIADYTVTRHLNFRNPDAD
ncbi:cardiolipin synthase B [Sphingobium sp. SCG-1]|uniref:phospholipase D-like domain-containing protein n=1 Tax=Sphingobium sp. SCG-1 TaxID=2072936 RepID=UPI000CD6A43E|nr:phosphatidylserine/phosphatidylglycerophosphate/cardiolipin synthase family protein [Sphingobium sp. SCG-1]AUW60087.1 cardiolipin synthase B [Sphingobium sp. SCG-1]